ncbi:CDP-alcohol phosphatidyltransferase family protein [Streptomyces sp. NPDC059785]|uniref:CDP-alcohol phosphatidyltransferase family protein n=1 Tax=unclassified Streptomyces TaxID=2593676 RepID=UPI0036484573
MPSRDIPPLAEVRRITQKKRDAWWTVILVDPVATPLVRLTARYTRITPNQITWGALLLGLVSAGCFAMGDWRWLIAGALVYHLSFILDCMDGKVARLTGQGSVFGAWLDYIFDRIRVMACAVALMAGQYHRTGETLYIWLAAAVVFLDGLRYINSLEIFKTRHTMRKQIKSRIREARRAENNAGVAFMEDLLRDNPEADIEQDLSKAAAAGDAYATTDATPATYDDLAAHDAPSTYDAPAAPAVPATHGDLTAPAADGFPAAPAAQLAHDAPPAHTSAATDDPASTDTDTTTTAPSRKQVIDLHQEFRHRFPAYLRLRSFLLRHRIRTHLISGIEFQMGVFIVGPLLDSVIEVTAVSGALLLVFELAIVYKLLLSTRDFTRTLDSFDRENVTTAA